VPSLLYSGSRATAAPKGSHRRPIIRSNTHAPDQPIERPRLRHWTVDLTAPRRAYSRKRATIFMIFRELSHPKADDLMRSANVRAHRVGTSRFSSSCQLGMPQAFMVLRPDGRADRGTPWGRSSCTPCPGDCGCQRDRPPPEAIGGRRRCRQAGPRGSAIINRPAGLAASSWNSTRISGHSVVLNPAYPLWRDFNPVCEAPRGPPAENGESCRNQVRGVLRSEIGD
jgi:hypothetical protein